MGGRGGSGTRGRAGRSRGPASPRARPPPASSRRSARRSRMRSAAAWAFSRRYTSPCAGRTRSSRTRGGGARPPGRSAAGRAGPRETSKTRRAPSSRGSVSASTSRVQPAVRAQVPLGRPPPPRPGACGHSGSPRRKRAALNEPVGGNAALAAHLRAEKSRRGAGAKDERHPALPRGTPPPRRPRSPRWRRGAAPPRAPPPHRRACPRARPRVAV